MENIKINYILTEENNSNYILAKEYYDWLLKITS
jgi:hypothetical protein